MIRHISIIFLIAFSSGLYAQKPVDKSSGPSAQKPVALSKSKSAQKPDSLKAEKNFTAMESFS